MLLKTLTKCATHRSQKNNDVRGGGTSFRVNALRRFIGIFFSFLCSLSCGLEASSRPRFFSEVLQSLRSRNIRIHQFK
jgi:hypothetical protein